MDITTKFDKLIEKFNNMPFYAKNQIISNFHYVKQVLYEKIGEDNIHQAYLEIIERSGSINNRGKYYKMICQDKNLDNNFYIYNDIKDSIWIINASTNTLVPYV